MTTERLYYHDAYTVAFSAEVVERLTVDGRPALTLTRTYFYPAGGGQPADRGTIQGVEVLDVLTRSADKAVLHLLAGEVGGQTVSGQVDWARRFDHMQQHTGQHILTQAFVQEAGANTVGFHLSPDSVTIDLDAAPIAPDVLERVEDLVNQIICENRPVRTRFVPPNELDDVRVRLLPDDLATEGVRVVEVEGFDATACGGTHVARTGEIGLLKVVKLERRGEETRVEFRCGWRALADYRQKNAMVNRLAAEFTVGHWEIDQAVERLKVERQALSRELKAARSQLLDYEEASLLAGAPEQAGRRLVKRAFDERDAGEVRALASRLIQTPGIIALLGASGEKAQIVLARSADLPHDMAAILGAALPILGSDRGGGRPDFAQGGGVPAGVDLVAAALDEAERLVLAED